MHKLDCWEICEITPLLPSDMFNFYPVRPSLENVIFINGIVVDENDDDIIHLTGTLFELIEIEDGHIIRVDNDEKYILGEVRNRYEYEFGYESGGILKELVEIYKKKGMYKCKL